MAEELQEKEKTPSAKRKKRLMAGLLAAISMLAAGTFLWLRPSLQGNVEKTVSAADGIGTVNVQRVLQEHTQGVRLVTLREEQQELEDELRYLKQQLLRLMSPRLSEKPFQDAARQKTSQQIIRENSDFFAELDRQEKAKREELRPEYEKARDEINQLFLLEIFNTRLKIDNADSMKLSEETVRLLEAKLKDLQQQRGVRQKELRQKYEQLIREWKTAEADKRGIDIRSQWSELEGQNLSAELKKRSEAQRRDLNALQQNMKQRMELRSRIAELQLAVKNKQSEADALEAELLRMISGRVAKLAMMHNLGVVLADKSENKHLSSGLSFKDIPTRYRKVVNIHAVDLTDDLMKELRTSK